MKIYYDDDPYEVYGSYGYLDEAYFILWDSESDEFITVPVGECSARKP